MEEKTKTVFEKLAEPMDFQWRVQSINYDKTKFSCVAYIDARDAMKRLDEVFTPAGWKDDYKEIKGNLFACVAIKVDGEWVEKWDAGAESAVEKEKGEASDSFKRACVKWGLGRFLYDQEIRWVKADPSGKFPVDDYGKRIWDLTKHFNGSSTTSAVKTPQKPSSEVTGAYKTKAQEKINEMLVGKKNLATDKQIKAVYAIGKGKGKTEDEIKEAFKVQSLNDITFEQASAFIDKFGGKREPNEDVDPSELGGFEELG